MFIVLIFMYVTLTNAIDPGKPDENAETQIKEVIGKYLTKVPDKDSNYIVDEGLAKIISNYYKGQISAFPLFKISVKFDRNPVKIPWTVGGPNVPLSPTQTGKEYKLIKDVQAK